jgi:hypothetical protein
MQPHPGRLAPYLLVEVFQNASVILATMWSFFGSTRFIHLAPAAAAVFYFAHPISWPNRNVNAASLLMLPTHLLVLEALTLSSRHRRRTDPHSMTAFREERQDMAAETNIVAEQW